jgi:8-oxo-dGTP pyrophosphatase MutT (NUDIX family)
VSLTTYEITVGRPRPLSGRAHLDRRDLQVGGERVGIAVDAMLPVHVGLERGVVDQAAGDLVEVGDGDVHALILAVAGEIATTPPPSRHTETVRDFGFVDELSVEERQALAARCLAGLPAGRQPLELFSELGTVELVGLRTDNNGREQVLLVQRPGDDRWWPGLWHLPGTVVLPDDRDLSAVVTRLLRRETRNALALAGELQVWQSGIRHGVRGTELTAFCWGELEQLASLPSELSFIETDRFVTGELELSTVDGHRELVAEAMRARRAFLKR